MLKPDGTVRSFEVNIKPIPRCSRVPNAHIGRSVYQAQWGRQLYEVRPICNVYQQVVLDEESQPYVTITTHLRLYRYTRLPFGIVTAPAIFQQIIDKLLNGLSQTGGILDDLIVTGEDEAQHVSNLHKTLAKLERCGVKLKKSKCAILQPQFECFAFVVDHHGIHPSPAKVKATLELQEHQNKIELQSFLGLSIITRSSFQTCLPAQQAAGQGTP